MPDGPHAFPPAPNPQARSIADRTPDASEPVLGLTGSSAKESGCSGPQRARPIPKDQRTPVTQPVGNSSLLLSMQQSVVSRRKCLHCFRGAL